jgi:uncharacterized membrane protein YphA (DoxX/SURF4 family)
VEIKQHLTSHGLASRLAAVGLLAFCMFTAQAAHSQSCALCYTQAASSGARVIQALRSGILVLIIPPAFLSVGVTVLAYRKRDRFANSESTSELDQNW